MLDPCWKVNVGDSGPDRSGPVVSAWRRRRVAIRLARRRRTAVGAGAWAILPGATLWSLGPLGSFRSVRRTERLVAAVGMDDKLGVDHTAVEAALHGDRLALGPDG